MDLKKFALSWVNNCSDEEKKVEELFDFNATTILHSLKIFLDEMSR